LISMRTPCVDTYIDGVLVPDTQNCSDANPSIYYIYNMYPDGTQSCIALDMSMGVPVPEWVQTAGYPTGSDVAFRIEDEVIDGVRTEVWNRRGPPYDLDHVTYWDPVNGVPVRLTGPRQGSAFVLADKNFYAFDKNATIDPNIYRPPRICLQGPILKPDLFCEQDLPLEIPVSDYPLYCPYFPPSPGILMGVAGGNGVGTQGNGNNSLGTSSIAGIAAAASIVAAVVGWAIHKNKNGRASSIATKLVEDDTGNSFVAAEGRSVQSLEINSDAGGFKSKKHGVGGYSSRYSALGSV